MSNSTTSALAAAERHRRNLASAVKRLRVAATTDPAQVGELADTLVELVGSRLLAWSFTEAAADAPESVVLSARILAERGPIGPYASADDAVRYFTASVQLAAVQAGLGQFEAAGRTFDALDAWRSQLGRLPLVEHLSGETVVWALIARGRSLLPGDVALANAYADAALLRLYAAGLDLKRGRAYLAMAAHLLAAEGRWAAGRTESALAQHRLALTRYQAVSDGIDGAARPAVVQVAVAPLAELFGPFALRLEAGGDQSGALAVRRQWVALLAGFGEPDTAPGVTLAKVALGRALRRAGREAEAATLAAPLAQAPAEVPLPVPGERVEWSPLPPTQALSGSALSVAASVRLGRDEQEAIAAGAAARATAELAEERMRSAAEQAAAAQAAEQAEAELRAAAAAAAAARAAAERQRIQDEAAAERRAALAAAEQEAAAERRRERAAAREQSRVVDPQVLDRARAALPDAREQVAAAGAEPGPLAAAQERLAELLRPLAVSDPEQYRDELVTALDTLVSLRWRLGDPEGSREAARERKTW